MLLFPVLEVTSASSFRTCYSTGLERSSSFPAQNQTPHSCVQQSNKEQNFTSIILYMMLLLMQPKMIFAFLGTKTDTGCSDQFIPHNTWAPEGARRHKLYPACQGARGGIGPRPSSGRPAKKQGLAVQPEAGRGLGRGRTEAFGLSVV